MSAGRAVDPRAREQCPVLVCRSARVVRIPASAPLALSVARAWGSRLPCELALCRACGVLWEPWPDGTPEDCVERAQQGPCSNCAYRAESPESLDPAQRTKLRELAARAAHDVEAALAGAWFACHKGVPIRYDAEHGIRFDYQAAGINPRLQTCGGFLRLLWAEHRRAERTSPAEPRMEQADLAEPDRSAD